MDKAVQDILNDPFTSDWLRKSLDTSLQRDPIDAAFDAEILSRLLNERANASLADYIPIYEVEEENE